MCQNCYISEYARATGRRLGAACPKSCRGSYPKGEVMPCGTRQDGGAESAISGSSVTTEWSGTRNPRNNGWHGYSILGNGGPCAQCP